jgi:uncharacterized cupredoxin-like copper-binding protein
MRPPAATLAVAATLLLAACGGSTSTGADHGGHATSTSGTPAAAQPADVATAARTVDIETTDALKFEPPSVEVRRGETVAFKVTNAGHIDHEFEVGDAAFQDRHETEMKDMGADMSGMNDEPTGFVVPPGQTKTIAFTFAASGSVLYGCHEPGHYAGGMKGTINVD